MCRSREFDVLVTHGWGRIAYNIVRSLGRRGLKVVLGTDEFQGMAVLSRYTAANFRHPVFVRHTEEFLATLKQYLKRYAPSVYIPSEQEVLLVAHAREQFNGLETRFPIAPFVTLCLLHKKDTLAQLAASLDIPSPETIVPRNLQDIIQFAREFGDPVVLKRKCSSAARGVFYVTQAQMVSPNGASAIHTLPFGEFLVQRYVRGTGYGVSMLFNHGKLRAKFTHKRLRERISSGGVSTLRMSVQNTLLEEYAEKILREVDFHGVAMVEFKYDEKLKRAWLLEVNPRFWGSLALAIHSGVDFPYLLYKMAVEGDVEPVMNYKTNVYARWIMGDLLARIQAISHNGYSSAAPTPPPSARVFDDFEWRDPLPFAGQFAFSAWKFFRTLGSRPEEADVLPDRL